MATKNNKYQIMVPTFNQENSELGVIHWSEPSLQSFKANVVASSWSPEFIASDPHCRVYSPKIDQWVDVWLSELLDDCIYEEQSR